jgi:uncharacterized protein YcbX
MKEKWGIVGSSNLKRSDGSVSELWRYPVKSFLGECLHEVVVETRGLAGDRLYAVTDREGRIGSGKTTRRFRRLEGLFEFQARSGTERPIVTLPDGREFAAGDPHLDDLLSERYGMALRISRESGVRHHDAAPLHLLTTSSLSWLAKHSSLSKVDRRRFRPNVLVETQGEGPVEDAWIGSRFALGSVVIRITERTERCVMITNPQADLPRDPTTLTTVAALNDNRLGVLADVEKPGVVRVGDRLRKLRSTAR